jgi:predicted nuclease with TOPRIM domain
MFGRKKDETHPVVREEITKIINTAVESKLDEFLDMFKDTDSQASKLKKLRKEVQKLESEKSKIQEDFAAKEREIQHMVGLHKKQVEHEMAMSKKETILEVRQENMDSEREAFQQQMDFMQDRFEQEVKAQRNLVEQLLKAVPSAQIFHSQHVEKDALPAPKRKAAKRGASK